VTLNCKAPVQFVTRQFKILHKATPEQISSVLIETRIIIARLQSTSSVQARRRDFQIGPAISQCRSHKCEMQGPPLPSPFSFLPIPFQPPPQTSPCGEGETPSLRPPPFSLPPQRLRRLNPRAYGARPRPQRRLPRVLWAPSDAPVTEIDP